MDRDEFVLFIDETGTASPNDRYSQHYVLAGCAVLESEREKLRVWADHIKYKYWNRTDVVFHSRDIARKEGDFRIFGSAKRFNAFISDLEEYFNARNFYMFAVVVDKSKAKKMSWDEIKIYKETSALMLQNFLYFLTAQKAKGKVVIESATATKDFYFHRSLGVYLAGGIPSSGIKHTDVKETLTSISFVTKNNHDTEEQIADLFAYAAKCEYIRRSGTKPSTRAYDEMILRVLKKKLVSKSKLGAVPKPKHLKHLQAFEILPQPLKR